MYEILYRVASEPSFRLLSQLLIKYLPVSLPIKSIWDVCEYHHYLMGILKAVLRAKEEGHTSLSVIEMGCAGGNGLLVMTKYSKELGKIYGIDIQVYGFDKGEGMPQLCEGYKDHPNAWSQGILKWM
ncbi:hypothetical protein [Pseudoalteromonas piscicida]|uniref:hypothetical protein n=1 Tax=Pseudoalteromonas piscicida TaxID=43662 RepID=UPI00309B7AEB